jgi:putative ABC transport system permease protein
MLARIALRNLTRNRRRTLLALLVVAWGAASLLLTAGFVRQSFEGLGEAFVYGGLGHLEIAPAAGGAGPDRAAPPSFADWRVVQADVEGLPHVVGASGAIVLNGLVARDERTLPFVGAGLEPGRERRMGLIARLKAGRPLGDNAPAAGEDEALLGLGLARQLGANVGDVVTLTSMTVGGTLNALDATVVGLVTTGVQELDERFLRVHLATAQRVLGTDEVSSLVVMLDATRRTEELRGVIGRRLRGRALEVTTWQQRAPFYRQVRTLYGGIFVFLGGIVVVLVCLSSSNTLLMSVMERVREIGALLAIGTSPGQVVRMVVLEAAWLGLIGGLLGCVLGVAVTLLIHSLHVRLPPPPGAVDPMDLALSLVAWDPIWVVGATVTMLVAAAAVPAWRILRLRIVEALSHV